MELESAGNQERMTKETWKRTVLEEAGKCGNTWTAVKRLACNSQMEMLPKCPMFLMFLVE
jgi:hypothetical protein